LPSTTAALRCNPRNFARFTCEFLNAAPKSFCDIASSSRASVRAVDGLPRLTLRMAARIQGFPDDWQFFGKKTATYRQIGNAFPPPVATAVGVAIRDALAGVHAKRKAPQVALFG